MAQYSEGFRERAVQMMMAPAAKSVAQVSRETGALVGRGGEPRFRACFKLHGKFRQAEFSIL